MANRHRHSRREIIAAREYEVDQLWGRSVYQGSPRWTSPGSSMRSYHSRWQQPPAINHSPYPYNPQQPMYSAERVGSPQTWDTFSTLSSSPHPSHYQTHRHAGYGSPRSHAQRDEVYSARRGPPSESSLSGYGQSPHHRSSSSHPMSPNQELNPMSPSHETSGELVRYRGKVQQQEEEFEGQDGEHQASRSGIPSPAWSNASQHTYSRSGSSLGESSRSHPIYHQYPSFDSPRMPGAMPHYPPRPFVDPSYSSSEYTYADSDGYLSDDLISNYTSSDLSDLSDDSVGSGYSDYEGYYSN